MKRAFIWFLVSVAFILIILSTVFYLNLDTKKSISDDKISDFVDCVNSGYPVLESYPRQCKTKTKTFIEEIITENIIYVSEDLEKCKLIKFTCEENKEAFFDQKGCGCKEKKVENLCQSEPNENFVCTAEYHKVCGWFDNSKIQCLKYPCAKEYSNPCLACSENTVKYWTEGACPIN